mmetsp:Transcript_27868/g.81594  ORF Transcript_27868/g.81594 Transcript_27868/m.81594 type:complete len:603 (-) Transcript_27868:387-2195(-)
MEAVDCVSAGAPWGAVAGVVPTGLPRTSAPRSFRRRYTTSSSQQTVPTDIEQPWSTDDVNSASSVTAASSGGTALRGGEEVEGPSPRGLEESRPGGGALGESCGEAAADVAGRERAKENCSAANRGGLLEQQEGKGQSTQRTPFTVRPSKQQQPSSPSLGARRFAAGRGSSLGAGRSGSSLRSRMSMAPPLGTSLDDRSVSNAPSRPGSAEPCARPPPPALRRRSGSSTSSSPKQAMSPPCSPPPLHRPSRAGAPSSDVQVGGGGRATPAPPSEPAAPASRFSGWTWATRQDFQLRDLRAVSYLGRGHFGSVQSVVLEREGREPELFALKSMKKDAFKRKGEEKYAFWERDTMRAVNHPFHIQIVSTFKSATRLYMLLEYAPHGELSQRIVRRAGLAKREDSRFYAANVLLALKYLHERGIIHRDVKPANLLLDARGFVKMCDFGFARELPLGERTLSIAGTYSYLSPEQCANGAYDHGVDIWSWGITIYEMLFGVTPFEAPRDELFKKQTMLNIQEQPLIFPADFADRNARDLLGKVLHRNAAERMGACSGCFEPILAHPWFKEVDWDALEKQEIQPPPPCLPSSRPSDLMQGEEQELFRV